VKNPKRKSSVSLVGGKVLTSDGDLSIADIHIAEGQIVETRAADCKLIDCRGYYVLPGIVDVHGDTFEVELYPRPGVDIDFQIAMRSVDRQLLANGITTAFHGLTVSWEPGARSLAAARRFMAELHALRPRLMADHRVQLRWEVFAHDAIEDVARWLSLDPIPIAFNDHTTSTMETVSAGGEKELDKWARRAGVTPERYLADIDSVSHRAREVQTKIREVADLARRHRAVMLAHDERKLEDRLAHRGLGMLVSEFPLAPDVAADAVANGEHVVMGGPNAVRGGSHKGSVSAEDAIRDGFCTVLASDYYYPSLLHAAERVVGRGVLPMSEAWSLVSQNPATAMRLKDRGRINIGGRADLVVIDCSSDWRLVHTIVGGTIASFGV
jgi:alpha-D-ribose 1-methylphosphonate 5-triphosphate diphosphatase